MPLKFTASELQAYVDEVFPQQRGRFEVLELRPRFVRVRMHARDAFKKIMDPVMGLVGKLWKELD